MNPKFQVKMRQNVHSTINNCKINIILKLVQSSYYSYIYNSVDIQVLAAFEKRQTQKNEKSKTFNTIF
jgi:hypothetical protein